MIDLLEGSGVAVMFYSWNFNCLLFVLCISWFVLSKLEECENLFAEKFTR